VSRAFTMRLHLELSHTAGGNPTCPTNQRTVVLPLAIGHNLQAGAEMIAAPAPARRLTRAIPSMHLEQGTVRRNGPRYAAEYRVGVRSGGLRRPDGVRPSGISESGPAARGGRPRCHATADACAATRSRAMSTIMSS
jgi:hypothetical protein